MKLGNKVRIAKQAIDSLLKHDDEPVAGREVAAQQLIEHIETELAAAQKREQVRIAASLTVADQG